MLQNLNTVQELQNPELSGKVVSSGLALKANNPPEQTHDKFTSLQAEYSRVMSYSTHYTERNATDNCDNHPLSNLLHSWNEGGTKRSERMVHILRVFLSSCHEKYWPLL